MSEVNPLTAEERAVKAEAEHWLDIQKTWSYHSFTTDELLAQAKELIPKLLAIADAYEELKVELDDCDRKFKETLLALAKVNQQIDTAEAENERLREALHLIKGYAAQVLIMKATPHEWMLKVDAKARQALEKEGGSDD